MADIDELLGCLATAFRAHAAGRLPDELVGRLDNTTAMRPLSALPGFAPGCSRKLRHISRTRTSKGGWPHEIPTRSARCDRSEPLALGRCCLRARARREQAYRAGRSLPSRLAQRAVRFRTLRLPVCQPGFRFQGVPVMKALLNSLRRFALTGLVVLVALWAGTRLWDYYMNEPWTRDGHVRADVVPVAPDVSGFVTEVLVRDNQRVQRGDVLFRIDRARYDIARKQAEAVLLGKRAMLEAADADLTRYSALTPGVVVSRQRMDQVIATQGSAQAAHDQAVADLGLAKLNLERSEVRAAVSGVVSNMELRPGTYLTPGKGVLALLDSDTLRVEGYFEETKLPRIHLGDAVNVRLLGSDHALRGRVESVAAGIEDRDRSASATLLANVNPTFNRVRLAQRVPVRIALDRTDASELVAGATATVEVLGSARHIAAR
ncbi:MAG TPA: HlyD family secretion protein [Bradyrhizobium sp.]|nr:HlyD family secretion protein [Bradyrhizobium sp.]